NAPIRKLARLLGWETIELIDPNAISVETDEWTVALVKSHNYGRDFVALQKLLPLNLRYVGLIGPRKRRNQLLNELLDVGVAGNSSRLGQPKQLLRISGKSLVRRTIDAASKAHCSSITVVTGGDHELIERELNDERVMVVQNKNWRHGIGTSIRAGVKKLVENV